MSDHVGSLVDEMVLWSLQVRVDGEGPWVDRGGQTSDWKAMLRTYDDHQKRFPDEPVRMVVTDVKVRVADPDWLRLRLSEGEVDESSTAN